MVGAEKAYLEPLEFVEISASALGFMAELFEVLAVADLTSIGEPLEERHNLPPISAAKPFEEATGRIAPA